MPNLLTRFLLFGSSYSPLFIILAVRLSQTQQLLAIVLIGFCLVSAGGLAVYIVAVSRLAPHTGIPREAKTRESEILSYVVTYLLPFLSFSFKGWRDVVSIGVFFSVIAILYVTSSMIHVNPLLRLVGFHMFEVTFEDDSTRLVLTRRTRIRGGQPMPMVSLAPNIELERQADDSREHMGRSEIIP